MRAFDRDLIRGGHYGQRSCEPHQQAEHMAAPTKPVTWKILLANSEPSTHGTRRHGTAARLCPAFGGIADIAAPLVTRGEATAERGEYRQAAGVGGDAINPTLPIAAAGDSGAKLHEAQTETIQSTILQ